MKQTAFIFDIDGTFLDAVDQHARAWQYSLLRHSIEVPSEKVSSQIGKRGDQLCPVFLNRETIDPIGKQIEKERAALFCHQYLPEARPFPQVRDMFFAPHKLGNPSVRKNRHQGLVVDRFHKMVIETRLNRSRPITFLSVARQSNQPRLGQLRMCSNPPRQFITIKARQSDVQNGNVRPKLLSNIQSC